MLALKPFLISIVIVAMRASTMACKFGLAIYVGSHLGLSALGLYSLAAGAIAMGPVVVGLGMAHVIMRDAVTQPIEELTKELRHYWYFTTSVYALALVIAVIATAALDASWLWALIVAITLFEHFGNDIFQLLSNLERPLFANSNAFLRSTAWILIFLPLAYWDPNFRSLSALFIFWLGGSVVALIQFGWSSRSWPWKAAFTISFQGSWITTKVKNAFLLYISDLSFVASQYIDRYLVTAFLGLRLAGVYFLYWSVANAVSTFVSFAVLQIQRPRLIRAYSDGGSLAHRQLVSESMKTTALASMGFSVVVAAAFYLVLPLLSQPADVGNYLGAFVLIMTGMALRNIADLGAMGLFTAHRDHVMTLTSVTSVILLVFVQSILLPIAGLNGAGAAMIIAFAATILWRHRLLFGSPTNQAQSKASSHPRGR
jgi:O-antigen/teichoic acid export membrane protein